MVCLVVAEEMRRLKIRALIASAASKLAASPVASFSIGEPLLLAVLALRLPLASPGEQSPYYQRSFVSRAGLSVVRRSVGGWEVHFPRSFELPFYNGLIQRMGG